MASKIKHMARSHRGCGKNYNVFNRFKYTADIIKNRKEANKNINSQTISTRLNNAFENIKNRFNNRKTQGK